MTTIYGYFDGLDEIEITFDPGLEVPCPVCQRAVGHHSGDNPIKTISVMLDSDPETGERRDYRSYFYRVHKSCYDGLTPEQQASLDYPIVDARARLRETN